MALAHLQTTTHATKMKPTDKLLPRQEVAIWYLNRPEITEVLYGGAAGGAKTTLGCLRLMECAEKFPGSRWLMGRSHMKSLKETTKASFDDLVSSFGKSKFFRWKEQGGYYECANGSEILLKDLKFYPSDPQYSGLGSLEITGAFIDEANQVRSRAKNLVKSRCRYKLKEWDVFGNELSKFKVVERNKFGVATMWENLRGQRTRGLTPKVLMSCNPDMGFVYDEFYEPYKKKHLLPYRAFIPSLPKDNPHLPDSYIEALEQMEESDRQRLLYGNWEYTDNPDWLISDYSKVQNLLDNPNACERGRCITCDAARFGKDKAVILVWQGWKVIDFKVWDKSKVTEIAEDIKQLRFKYGIHLSDIVVDDNGVGGGVVDIVGCEGFVNNARPFLVDGIIQNYDHLKSQCGFYLADMINDGYVGVSSSIISSVFDQIKKELQALKKQPSDDGKLKLIQKKDMKVILNGESPNFLDTMIMRSYFEFRPIIRNIQQLN